MIIIILFISHIAFAIGDINCVFTNNLFELMNNSNCSVTPCILDRIACNNLNPDMYFCGECTDGSYYYSDCLPDTNNKTETCVSTWFDNLTDTEIYYCDNNTQDCSNIQNIVCYNDNDTYYYNEIEIVHDNTVFYILISVFIPLMCIVAYAIKYACDQDKNKQDNQNV